MVVVITTAKESDMLTALTLAFVLQAPAPVDPAPAPTQQTPATPSKQTPVPVPTTTPQVPSKTTPTTGVPPYHHGPAYRPVVHKLGF